jgi:hypothetical protein
VCWDCFCGDQHPRPPTLAPRTGAHRERVHEQVIQRLAAAAALLQLRRAAAQVLVGQRAQAGLQRVDGVHGRLVLLARALRKVLVEQLPQAAEQRGDSCGAAPPADRVRAGAALAA